MSELAEQAAAKAQALQQAGEGLRLSVDQERQLQEITGLRGELEKLKADHEKETDSLQKQVDSLGKDNSSLLERNKFLQEKNKKLSKDHKDAVEKLTKIQADTDKQLV